MAKYSSLFIAILFLSSCMSSNADTASLSPKTQNSSVVQSASSSPDTITKPNMDALDISTQLIVERLCRDFEQDGLAPYWNCLRKELKKLEGISKPNMDAFDINTQLIMERRCRDFEQDGVIPFWNCLRKEIASVGISSTEQPVETPKIIQQETLIINETPTEEPLFTSKPDMSDLDEPEIFIIEGFCEIAKPFGIQKYWGCLHRQIEASRTVIRPDFSQVDEETGDIILNS